MPMDETDKKLTKGLVWALVLGGVAYIFPGYGYQAQQQAESDARGKLESTAQGYSKHYPQMHPAYLGLASTQEMSAPVGVYTADLQSQYKETNANIDEHLEAQQSSSRMNFPGWTEVPERFIKNPGVYFVDTWKTNKEKLLNEWRAARVECLDDDIGFGKFTGDLTKINENKAKELLRELFIAENIIRLCISAKLQQEQSERDRSFQPEAFMRIISVTPQESDASRPTELVINPKFNAGEKNPNSEKFRRYNVRSYRPFIQEYPVELVLQCDIHTFMRFLHSVRNPGSFLVIRSLEITSPFVNESLTDKSEMRIFSAPDANDPKAQRLTPPKDEHVLVKMSAAGMDFFDPEQYPNGLYSGKVDPNKKTSTRRRREIRTAP